MPFLDRLIATLPQSEELCSAYVPQALTTPKGHITCIANITFRPAEHIVRQEKEQPIGQCH